jgi:putative transposase
VRLTAAEKGEVIRLVEGSDLSVRQTLRELQVPRATFYTWYRRYAEGGLDGLVSRPSAARRHWNRIPPRVRQRVVDLALAVPERTPRELAWQFTDREGHFLSESSVYRILKAFDLITSPAFVVLSAGKVFQHPTRRPNELWQTDFTYLHVVGWGWYYLSTVLDDYSRYILAWTLRVSMQATDVMETLDLARAVTGVDHVPVAHRPRLLSDNGPCYISEQLATYLEAHGLPHTRSAPYHPMTQGKIERYHRSLKNVVKLEHYYTPWEVERAVAHFVEDYNHRRYHEALQNVTPADMFYGRQATILARRARIKQRTLQQRKRENLHVPHHAAIRSKGSLRNGAEVSNLV